MKKFTNLVYEEVAAHPELQEKKPRTWHDSL